MTKSYSIVGINHTKKEAFVAALKGGEEAVLVREPLNPYDPLAVAIWIGGERVGYVPKKQNHALAQFIDQEGQPWETPVVMAADGKHSINIKYDRSITAKFIRSPNSGFPMV